MNKFKGSFSQMQKILWLFSFFGFQFAAASFSPLTDDDGIEQNDYEYSPLDSLKRDYLPYGTLDDFYALRPEEEYNAYTRGYRRAFIGKRSGSRAFIGKRNWFNEPGYDTELYSPYLSNGEIYWGKRARHFIGKRSAIYPDVSSFNEYENLDKRRSFIGKRFDVSAMDKRRSFIGKRNDEDLAKLDMFKRRSFIGKRSDMEEEKRRSFIGKREDQEYNKRRSFIGKRFEKAGSALDLDQISDILQEEDKRRSFIGKKSVIGEEEKRRSFIGKRPSDSLDDDMEKRRSFIGKRVSDNLNDDYEKRRSFIGKRPSDEESDSYEKRRSFIGKREGETVDKRRSFIGKKSIGSHQADKRRSFIGKRDQSDESPSSGAEKRRSFIGK